jgi:hypothetical protein
MRDTSELQELVNLDCVSSMERDRRKRGGMECEKCDVRVQYQRDKD